MILHIDQRPAHINMLYQPQRILSGVRKFMGEEDIVISDVGAHKMWIAREYNCYRPNTCIISHGFATMGIAVPGQQSLYIRKGRYFGGCFPPECPLHYRMSGGLQ